MVGHSSGLAGDCTGCARSSPCWAVTALLKAHTSTSQLWLAVKMMGSTRARHLTGAAGGTHGCVTVTSTHVLPTNIGFETRCIFLPAHWPSGFRRSEPLPVREAGGSLRQTLLASYRRFDSLLLRRRSPPLLPCEALQAGRRSSEWVPGATLQVTSNLELSLLLSAGRSAPGRLFL
jgi:hypothetical protein